MVEKSKSKKNGKSKLEEASTPSMTAAESGGLTASLDALKKIADKGQEGDEAEVVHLRGGKSREKDGSVGSARELVDELDEKYSNNSDSLGKKGSKTAKEHKERDADSLGVVELLGALKSDIDSLRKDNEEFKAELMGRKNTNGGSTGDSSDVRALLEALKNDIGNLRHETDDLRSQAFSEKFTGAGPDESADQEDAEDRQLYSMLAELKDDIVSLRSENEVLRHGNVASKPVRPGKKSDEVAMLLHELKADMNDLKHENESLRLENLTARDGARFENLGGQPSAYRNTQGKEMTGFLKGLGALVLVAGAAGGGYYLAKSQGEGQPVVSRTSSGILLPAERAARADKPSVTVKPTRAPEKPRVTASKKAANGSLRISSDTVSAMMARADGLLDARDLGAARMVYVYLARNGSPRAMARLAQTYDPQMLVKQGFDVAKNGDLTRAVRLYGAASGMGDVEATRRLQELQ